jgi:hypothetical protein
VVGKLVGEGQAAIDRSFDGRLQRRREMETGSIALMTGWYTQCNSRPKGVCTENPAIYFERTFVDGGGLISYGPDLVDQYQRAASYVDRILRGEKSADLPVQSPTKFQLVINSKTAKALDLEVPMHLQQIADEVIE